MGYGEYEPQLNELVEYSQPNYLQPSPGQRLHGLDGTLDETITPQESLVDGFELTDAGAIHNLDCVKDTPIDALEFD